MAVALAALGARVRLAGPDGDRWVEMPGLHRLPGDTPDRDTVLSPGELITEVELPPPPAGRSAYRKVRERASFAFALVSLAAVLDVGPDGRVRECRLALGGVAHAPWRASAAEEVALLQPATPETFARAAEEELRHARPLPGNEYKVTLARNLIVSVESAMDELAVALGMDPVELRIRNDPPAEPESGLPFSSRNLVACLRAGAERFGWADRDPRPGVRRRDRQRRLPRDRSPRARRPAHHPRQAAQGRVRTA